MCGILGYYGKHNQNFSKKCNLDLISHRGPDNQQSTIEKNLFFGHTRLSIQDLSSHANQPMYSLDKRYLIIFNGEIYNHLELRDKFLKDINFISTGDTETILYGIIKYGKKFILKLNGIFAFSFYDLQTGEYMIVRDFFGVKPLYYVLDSNEVFFSSEMKVLIPHLNSKTINYKSIINYLNFLWSPGEDTPLNEIKKLLPGHMITGNSNNISNSKIEKYYQISFNNKNVLQNNENEIIELCEQHLVNAVRRQLLSDVPLGFFLSGGLDSSLIVAIAKKILPNEKFECFTINTKEFSKEGFSDDLHYAKKVARYLDVNLNIVEANLSILENFDKVIYHLDEPQADPASINVYNICKLARSKGVKVLLGGTGGDDLFSGYRRHQALRYEYLYKYIPMPIKILIKKIVMRITSKKVFFRRLKKLFYNIHKSKNDRFYSYFDWIDIDIIKNLFNKKISYDHHSYFKKLDKDLPDDIGDLNRILFYEMNSFLVDHNLNYTDKLSMATGVEVRVPFLDKDLVEFSTKIPINLKLKDNETKYILKKIAEKYLPKEIIYRSKAGFGAPVRKWITSDMKIMIDDYMQSINKRKIFNHSKVKQLVTDNKSGKIDASYTIWAMLALESWLQQFYDK